MLEFSQMLQHSISVFLDCQHYKLSKEFLNKLRKKEKNTEFCGVKALDGLSDEPAAQDLGLQVLTASG